MKLKLWREPYVAFQNQVIFFILKITFLFILQIKTQEKYVIGLVITQLKY